MNFAMPKFAFALAILAASPVAMAIVNPNFTPVDLVSYSDVILRIEVGSPGSDGAAAVKVLRAIKGKPADELKLVLDVSDEKMAAEFRRALGDRKSMPALMLAGDFSSACKGDAADADAKPVGAIHVDTTNLGGTANAWFALKRGDDGTLRIVNDSLDLKSVWAGSNTMLEKAFDYVIADPRADVPVAIGSAWAKEAIAPRIAGKAHGMLAVDGGRLLVLSDTGDRVLAVKKSDTGIALEDVTASLKLATMSRCAAVGDFDGDGTLDFAVADGKAIRVVTAAACREAAACPAQALDCLDVGSARAGLLVSTSSVPLLVAFDAEGKAVATPVAAYLDWPGAKLGAAGPCCLADFDSDGIADILQPFAKGALFYKGTGGGKFAAPAPACLAALSAPVSAHAGDFDADGLLDVVLAAAEGIVLLINQGGGKFADQAFEAGELPYKMQPGAVAAFPCEINNDGRQDLAVAYGKAVPQLFFSRGFRCFGFGSELDLTQATKLKVAEALRNGQQAATLADFDGDGAEDLAAVGAEGDVCLLLRQTNAARMGVAVALPAGMHGPVTVTAQDGKRSLGARVCRPGQPALFGKMGKTPLTLSWIPAGEKPRTQQVVVTGSKRVELAK